MTGRLRRTVADAAGMSTLSLFLIRLGLALQVRCFRRELKRLDNGTVELWGTALGLDEEGCVCSEEACFFRRYHQDEQA